jgi:hypothetical protein
VRRQAQGRGRLVGLPLAGCLGSRRRLVSETGALFSGGRRGRGQRSEQGRAQGRKEKGRERAVAVEASSWAREKEKDQKDSEQLRPGQEEIVARAARRIMRAPPPIDAPTPPSICFVSRAAPYL